jgi:ABC-2 type transport system permease protein
MITNVKELKISAFLTILEKEVKRFLKVSTQTITAPIINAVLYLLIFGVSLGKFIQLDNGVPYLSFVIPGLMMMTALNNAFQNSSSSVITSKFSGDLEDLKVAPVSYMQITMALAVGGLARGLLLGFITFTVGTIFHFFVMGEFLAIKHPLILLAFLTVGGIAFALLGLACAMMAKSIDQIAAVSSYFLLPLTYLGGVFFSIDTLHPFWQKVSLMNPLFYFINGVRYGILGIGDSSWAFALIVCLITMFVFYIFAHIMLRKSSFIRW